MTIKTVTSIELGDIKTIEFECGTCHPKFAYKIEKFSRPPLVCIACQPNKHLFTEEDLTDLTHLVEIVKRFSKMGRDRFTLRFEITESSVSREAGGLV